jgi:UDPglucose 6-dehydrogenase
MLTERDQYRALDLDRVKRALTDAVLVDLRNIYKPADKGALSAPTSRGGYY